MPIEAIIEAMQEFYTAHGKNQSMEYTYGFFDALAVLRIMQDKVK